MTATPPRPHRPCTGRLPVGPRRGSASLLPGSSAGCLAASLALLVACSPALDWREMRPDGWALQLSLPCRPAQQTRTVALGASRVDLALMACVAQGHTFAVSSAALADPAAVAPALKALGDAARANLAGRIAQDDAAQVPGMTPQPGARHWRIVGRLPDGQPAVAEVLVFAHGLRVFQATVVGPGPTAALWPPFMEALRVRP